MPNESDSSVRTDPPPGGTEPARILVSERSGRWAVALRRELGPAARVHETRSVAECWASLAQSPQSLLVVEVTLGNLEALLGRMARRERDYPSARVAVVAERRLAGWEWLVREAGAATFVTSPRRLGGLAKLARRHLAQRVEQQVGTTEAVWASLPWKTA